MKTKLFLATLILGSASLFASDLKQGQLSNVTRLTSDASARYENPVWSPDGSQIAFTNEGYDGLLIINPKTKAVKALATDIGIGYMFQWAADSREILVRDTRWITSAQGIRRVHAAFSVSVDGKKTRLTDDDADMKPAAWRYDAYGNKSIVTDAKIHHVKLNPAPVAGLKTRTATAPAPASAFSFIEDCENLYIVDLAGNKRVLNAGPSFNAMLSPDGKKVAFNQLDDIYIINTDGSGKTKIAVGFHPQWVGNTQIVYERTSDNGHVYTAGDLFIYTIASKAEKALTTSKDRIEMNPAVSPDGSKIVFTSNNDGQLYIADLK